MKERLLELIDETQIIESKFSHCEPVRGVVMLPCDYIYDVQEFIEWKEELKFILQEIFDRTKDKYIENIIKDGGLISKIDGKSYDERKRFGELKAALLVIKKNINKYYPDKKSGIEDIKEKQIKFFISHASEDMDFVEPFVELLSDIGLTNDTLFCSSVAEYSIPLGENIYDYLAKQFKNYNLYVIFVLSDNYYKSPACLNEMGAAWVLKNKYVTILAHGFQYKSIDGAIDPRNIGLSVDDNNVLFNKRLGEIKDLIVNMLNLNITQTRWEQKRDKFIKKVRK